MSPIGIVLRKTFRLSIASNVQSQYTGIRMKYFKTFSYGTFDSFLTCLDKKMSIRLSCSVQTAPKLVLTSSANQSEITVLICILYMQCNLGIIEERP